MTEDSDRPKFTQLLFEAGLVVYPFLSGVIMAYAAMYHKWISFWIAAEIFIVFTMAVVYLNYQRSRAARVLGEMRERAEQGGKLASRGSDMIERLLVDNVRLNAIIAGLVGVKMRVQVDIRRVR